MLKLLKFFLAGTLVAVLVLLVMAINLKIVISSPQRIQKILAESSVYPAVAAGLREGFVKGSAEAEIPSDVLLEAANKVLDDATVTDFMNDLANQFTAAIQPKATSRAVVFHFSSLQTKVIDSLRANDLVPAGDEIPAFTQDKTYDLNNISWLWPILNINLLLVILSVSTLALIGLLLLGGTLASKFGWLGFSFLFAGIMSAISLAFVLFVDAGSLFELVAMKLNLENEKFIVGVKKLIILVMQYERTYLIVAVAALFAIAIVFLVLRGIARKKGPEPVSFESKEKKS